MLALSPRKQPSNTGNGTENEQQQEQKPNERPNYIHVANPFQNVQPPEALRSPTKARYSRDQLCDVFQSSVITPPDSVAMRQFDIFTDQLLKPLLLCQSSAEEQMACLLLSNGTWSPSGVPPAPGPPGRGMASGGVGGGPPMQMQGMNDGGPAGMGGNNNFRPQGQRGRGLAMQQRRFQQRPLESDRVDNWRQRPGPPPPGVSGPSSFSSNQMSSSEGINNYNNNNNSQQLWQSRQAESRLAPNWLMGTNSQPPQQTNIPSPDAVSPFSEPVSTSLSAPKSSNFDSLPQTEASKMFAEDIAPYWTSGKSSSTQPLQQSQPQAAPTTHSQPPQMKSPAPTPPAIIDGESLWNTLSSHDLQPQQQQPLAPSPQQQQQQQQKNLSPISADPAVVLVRKAAPTSDPPTPQVPEPPKHVVDVVPNSSPQSPDQEEQQAWFYVDPSGTLQGPFSGQQMEEWDNEGYFPDDLRLRPAVLGQNSTPTDERGFITLSKLRASAVQGGKSPFLQCNISPRQLTPREIAETKQQQQQQQQQSPLQFQPEQQMPSPRQQQALPPPVPEEEPKAVQMVGTPDIRRQSWGSSLSSVSSEADVPLAKPAVSRIAMALTMDVSTKDPEPPGWGDEPEPEEPEVPVIVEGERSKSKQGATATSKPSQPAQLAAEKKSRRRKKSSNKPPEREKEQPVDPLLNAEPAEVRRARIAAEQLRIAEENSRKLDDRDSMLAILEEKRILREKEREIERKTMAQRAAKAASANVPRSQEGPPALPATAKWAVAGKQGARPASLLEIQRQEEIAEQSERVQEEHRRILAAAITASTQQTQQNWSGTSSNTAPSNAAPWSSMPVQENRGRRQAQFGGGSGGFWDEGDDDEDTGLSRPSQSASQSQQSQSQSNRSVPKLSNILGSTGHTAQSSKTGTKQKESKSPLAAELSVLASWVVSELSRRYAAATSLSPDIVPAFARLLGTIDEVSGQDELMQRASPYFYRQEDARAFVGDFIAARTRLQQNPSLLQAVSSSGSSNAPKAQQKSQQQQQQPHQQQQHYQQQPEKQPARQQQPQQAVQEQHQQAKSKTKKKPIPVSASALFKLVGPPPPAPQLDE